MSSTERGILVHRPIIYGSQARLLTEEEKATAPLGHTHRWTIFLTSATSPPPETPLSALSSTNPPPIDMNYLPGGYDDLSYFIKRVTFRLHDTYANPNRVCDRPPYQVTETGWGEFAVQIKITFVPEAAEKPLALQHSIRLHHWGPPIEAAVPTEPNTTSATTVQPSTSGVALMSSAISESNPRSSTTPPNLTAVNDEAKPESAMIDEEKIKVDDANVSQFQTPAPTTTADGEDTAANETENGAVGITETPSSSANATELAVAGGPISIAATLPVHSWQYDELIFSDPPLNFLNLLNENPPTPLPARNRRPRDQREDVNMRSGKGKKAAKLGLGGRLRDGKIGTPLGKAVTVSNGTTVRDESVAPFTTATGVVGIPGEPGSADVPLEFSQEMEKSEWNRLNDVRIEIIEQMDKWRERLIKREKELSKLKEELAG